MLTEVTQIDCPYCGESIEIIVDGSVARQNYTEDCSVCCRPMELSISVSGEDIAVIARREDE
jgi:hypothetical protein